MTPKSETMWMAWHPMGTAPHDTDILAKIEMKDGWEIHLISLVEETMELNAESYDRYGFSVIDYAGWCELPDPKIPVIIQPKKRGKG